MPVAKKGPIAESVTDGVQGASPSPRLSPGRSSDGSRQQLIPEDHQDSSAPTALTESTSPTSPTAPTALTESRDTPVSPAMLVKEPHTAAAVDRSGSSKAGGIKWAEDGYDDWAEQDGGVGPTSRGVTLGRADEDEEKGAKDKEDEDDDVVIEQDDSKISAASQAIVLKVRTALAGLP